MDFIDNTELQEIQKHFEEREKIDEVLQEKVDVEDYLGIYNLDYPVVVLYKDYYVIKNFLDNNVGSLSFNIDHDPVNSVDDHVYVEHDYINLV